MSQYLKYFILEIVRYSPILVPLILVMVDIFARKQIKKKSKGQSLLFILPQSFCLCGVSFYTWLIITLAKGCIDIKAFKGLPLPAAIIFSLIFLLLSFVFYEYSVNFNKINHVPLSYAFAFLSLAFPFLLL